jgi:hypothetical protein
MIDSVPHLWPAMADGSSESELTFLPLAAFCIVMAFAWLDLHRLRHDRRR